MKTQAGQSGHLVTMKATKEGRNRGSLNSLVEQGPPLAMVNTTSGSA